jgi:beta-lactamase superfamily II metal-dependent hydrolase
MYRVGFGDCFLVSLPVGAAEQRHILVDCGVHAKGDIGSIAQVVANIVEVTGGKLAVVIATHAHQDHIAGFDRFGDQFAKLEIGEVWLPWTWDPADPHAVQLQTKQAALTEQLATHFAALAAGGALGAPGTAAADAISNLRGNAHAIALLNKGFGVGARVRYLKAGDGLTDPAGVSGLSVKVLGPPQSEEFLAQMNPPAGQEYLRTEAGGPDHTSRIEPFGARWRVGRGALPGLDTRLSKADEGRLDQTTGSPAEDLAFALDQARNNESVVTFLTYRGQNLLFAGDAQYGNWRWWLDNEQPDQILPEVAFYKVAHHGSVNATPKDALEKMADGHFAAMVSTQSTPWASIPRVPLMQRLSEKTKQKIVRSDWLPFKGAPVPAPKSAPAQPASPPIGFVQGALWFDYMVNGG